jgi:3-hydroxybutyryl-CoA dehydrogenase
MSSSQIAIEPEFYPIERLLIVGPLGDAGPLADRAQAAGHHATLLVPDEEIAAAHEWGKGHRVLLEGEAVGEDDFDLVVELHCTDLSAKAEALLYLEDALAENVPILTLALTVSAGELTREMLIPERVVGFSLLPPLTESALAELMPTPHTGGDALGAAERLFESLGIATAQVEDSPGGVLARTVCCLVNECALAVQEKIASAEDIDKALRLAENYPYGPLTWGDRIGLDRVLAVMEGLHAEYKEERYRPAVNLKQLVRAGHTGMAKGQGFFGY